MEMNSSNIWLQWGTRDTFFLSPLFVNIDKSFKYKFLELFSELHKFGSVTQCIHFVQEDIS
jgi:hypothetical protein